MTCLLKVDVKGTVNKYDLSELGRNVSKIKDRISENYHRIDNLLSQFGYINEENYESAKGKIKNRECEHLNCFNMEHKSTV